MKSATLGVARACRGGVCISICMDARGVQVVTGVIRGCVLRAPCRGPCPRAIAVHPPLKMILRTHRNSTGAPIEPLHGCDHPTDAAGRGAHEARARKYNLVWSTLTTRRRGHLLDDFCDRGTQHA